MMSVTGTSTRPRVLIRGVGDVGSAIAHQLFNEGFEVILQDRDEPHYPRRGMSFTDAMFETQGVMLEGVLARRCKDTTTLLDWLERRQFIPATADDATLLCVLLEPEILIDARMRKRLIPERQIHLAPLTIGIGPNFVAEDTVHLVIESSWGSDLGKIIRRGSAKPLAGTVREIAGYGVERIVYAPASGVFVTTQQIGETVTSTQQVGRINEVSVCAPLAGRLRGLTRSGVYVEQGTKILEIDPRHEAAVIFTLGERPLRIAAGVLEAIRQYAGK